MKNAPTRPKKALGRQISLAIGILLIGTLFKILHWPYGNLIMTYSFAAIGILYAVRFHRKIIKFATDYLKLIIVTAWIINGIFTIYHLAYRSVFEWMLSIAVVIWIVAEAWGFFTKSGAYASSNPYHRTLSQGEFLWRGTATTAIGFIVMGKFFEVLHYPFSSELLFGGYGLAVICLIWRGMARFD